MQANIHPIHFTPSTPLLEAIQRRIGRLTQLHDRLVSADVYLRMLETKEGENKVVEFKLQLPGRTLFVKEQCKTFEEAIDVATEVMKKQLTRIKERNLATV